MEKLKTVPEVAERYRYTEETIWKKCRQYQQGFPTGWPHLRQGRDIRFTQENIEAIDAMMNPAPIAKARKTKRQSLAA
ncbi:hypothetical protein ACIGB6_10220 [Paeniglutamicibacter gangotriensis]|uniref:hypothetical protein n=1 Tax=Paeniglutamicibacter gangotriensis TaxID=254787 RepID=UPI0037CA05A9